MNGERKWRWDDGIHTICKLERLSFIQFGAGLLQVRRQENRKQLINSFSSLAMISSSTHATPLRFVPVNPVGPLGSFELFRFLLDTL